jgi:hypothetical protein
VTLLTLLDLHLHGQMPREELFAALVLYLNGVEHGNHAARVRVIVDLFGAEIGRAFVVWAQTRQKVTLAGRDVSILPAVARALGGAT